MPLCLAAGAAAAVLAVEGFTLAWTHSIEKTRWEEDWRIEDRALVIVEARIRGTGAGMEPPAGARLEGGIWRYRPQLAALAKVSLSHSPHAGDYGLCAQGRCQPLAQWLPGLDNTAVVELRSCPP